MYTLSFLPSSSQYPPHLHVDRIGKKRAKVMGETDFSVSSFLLTYAGADEHGDLISGGQISIGQGEVPISIFVEQSRSVCKLVTSLP